MHNITETIFLLCYLFWLAFVCLLGIWAIHFVKSNKNKKMQISSPPFTISWYRDPINVHLVFDSICVGATAHISDDPLNEVPTLFVFANNGEIRCAHDLNYKIVANKQTRVISLCCDTCSLDPAVFCTHFIDTAEKTIALAEDSETVFGFNCPVNDMDDIEDKQVVLRFQPAESTFTDNWWTLNYA